MENIFPICLIKCNSLNVILIWQITFQVKILGKSDRLLGVSLTLCADDLESLPGAVGTATRGGNVALVEALGALVTHHWVDVVVGPPAANHVGVLHRGRGATQHCPNKVRQERCTIHWMKLTRATAVIKFDSYLMTMNCVFKGNMGKHIYRHNGFAIVFSCPNNNILHNDIQYFPPAWNVK